MIFCFSIIDTLVQGERSAWMIEARFEFASQRSRCSSWRADVFWPDENIFRAEAEPPAGAGGVGVGSGVKA